MRKRTLPPPRTVARSQSALRIEVLHPGEGPSPARGDKVQIHYTCLLAATNGCVDTSRAKGRREPMEITIGARQVVAGMEEGLQALALGAVARLHVPPHLGYGGVGAGPVPAGAALIFEVEVVKLNTRESAGLPVRVLRQLLVGGDDGNEPEEAAGSDDGGDGAPLVPAPSLLRWASALRTALPLPLPESAAFAAWLAAARARGLRTSELWRAVDGALPIARGEYGTPWDGATPLILGGERRGWAPAAWGWGFWARRYGDSLVLSKQRAPIFDDDLGAAPLMAETSLREYIAYARAPADETAPLLYMNGWDVFNAHPELWSDGLDQLPGSIDNRSASEYAALSAQFGQSDLAASRVRQLMKLFVGPRGAITRMHQDNHRAHAWLCNLRGHKLYVVAAPEESERVGPTGRGSEHGGTTRGCRLDPLDGVSRGERRGVVLHAAVLAPGETLVLPEGWWHYAASLTPSITLMCNFWDGANIDGLRDCFCDVTARAFDQARRTAIADAKRDGKPTPLKSAAAAPHAPTRALAPPATYRVVHSPFVYVREEPSTDAPLVTVARHGVLLTVDAERDGWLRTVGLQAGWVLEEGSALGLGALLTRVK